MSAQQSGQRRLGGLVALSLLFLVSLDATSLHAGVMNYPGLQLVRVWEATGATNNHDFVFNDPLLSSQWGVGTLGPANNDFNGLGNENYDVFYSDAAGNLNPNGDYVTIEAVFPNPNFGGGLNVGAVDLIINNQLCRADILASFVGLGPNYIPGSELLAVDPDPFVPLTFTTMGSTVVPPAQHLRITVGWSKIPEPASLGLASMALVASSVSVFSRRRGA